MKRDGRDNSVGGMDANTVGDGAIKLTQTLTNKKVLSVLDANAYNTLNANDTSMVDHCSMVLIAKLTSY